MGFVKYHSDIAKFLLAMESLKIHARVTPLAGRKMIGDQIPEDAQRRLSLGEYMDHKEWLDAVRTVTKAEEDFRERKGLRDGGPSGATNGQKRKFDDSKLTVAVKRVKKQNPAKEKVDYQRMKAGARRVKKEGWVAPAGEVKHTV